MRCSMALGPLLAGVVVSGCTHWSPDHGRADVIANVTQRVGSAPSVDASAAVDNPPAPSHLTATAAVQLAWQRNPQLQARFAELGIARADVLEAGRIGNPTLSYSRLTAADGPGESIAAGVTQSFADVLLLPLRKRLATGEFERMKLVVGGQLVDLAGQVDTAWYEFIGARQVADMRGAACVAAEASAALAQQFFDAGNITRLQLTLEQAALAQARIAVLTAEAAERRARSRLNTLIGLTSTQDHWQSDDRLALPVAGDADLDALQALAKTQRLDLAALTLESALDDQALRGARQWRWLGALDFSYGRERGPGDPIQRGPGISVQVPLFNQGQGTLARGQARQMATQARLRELEVAIDNDVALQVDRVTSARAVAEHYRTELIPQRDSVVRETQARVAYMLVGAFELLAAKQSAYDAYQSYLEALRDYWLARVDLQRAIGGQLPGTSRVAEPSEDANSLIHPDTGDAMPGMHHSGHSMESMTMPAEDTNRTTPPSDTTEPPHGELP